MKKLFTFSFIFVFAFFKLNAQEIYIKSKDQPLSEIFIELQNNYAIQFSFDNKLISDCIISKTKTYNSPEKAISDLIKNCNLDYEIVNNIFVIYKKQKIKNIKKPKYYYFSCYILDKKNKESLPFSNVQFNSNVLTADLNGHFLFKTKDSIVNLKVSHIGYYLLDTILNFGKNQNLKLNPAVHNLQEFKIISDKKKIVNYNLFFKRSGFIKINHNLHNFLPGNSNNTIFNILRLQAGILASGELNNDFIIWGSYKGQTLVLFDGITLFSFSNFDDNIGAINPLIIKDLEVKKGGYNVDFGNRVGGIINITSKTGNSDNLSGELNINNETINGILNIPIAKKYALQTSFRKTFYNIFDDKKIYQNENNYYVPDYKYQDINIKISNKSTENSNFYISLFASNDKFSFDKKKYHDRYSKFHYTEKTQFGASLFYNKKWNLIGKTSARISYSNLENHNGDSLIFLTEENNYYPNLLEKNEIENGILNFSINVKHYFPNKNRHRFSCGTEIIYNSSFFEKNDFDANFINSNENLFRTNYFIKDEININKKFFISPGLRLDLLNETNKFYIQPRINGFFNISKNTKINFAFGVYNQFIKENAIINNLDNYLYYWNICDDKLISVLNSFHSVLGFSYEKEYFNFKTEAFYKKINGLNNILSDRNRKFLSVIEGKSRTYGIDFYIKNTFKKHEFFITYNLSKTEEYFPNFSTEEFQKAPQDQRHEIKIANILNFYPFFISSNYVYGSGLRSSIFFTEERKIIPYSRLDIAFLYLLNLKFCKIKTGLSLINILDAENVNYSSFSHLPEDKTIYSRAIEFTPTIFLNLKFK